MTELNMKRIAMATTSLLALLAMVTGMAGCREALEDAKSVYKGKAGTETVPVNRSRVNAAAQTAGSTIPDGWCEKRYEPGKGPLLGLPQVETFSKGPADAKGRPRWINIWATWCKPCVAEFRHVIRWHDLRLGNGTDISLELLSVDSDVVRLKAFLARHLELRLLKMLRMANPDGLTAYAQSLGLDQETTVPIHIFTDRESHITCIRTGGIAESDLGVIRELLK